MAKSIIYSLSIQGAAQARAELDSVTERFRQGKASLQELKNAQRDATAVASALNKETRLSGQLWLAMHPNVKKVSESMRFISSASHSVLTAMNAINLAIIASNSNSAKQVEVINNIKRAERELALGIKAGLSQHELANLRENLSLAQEEQKQFNKEMDQQKIRNILTYGAAITQVTSSLARLVTRPEAIDFFRKLAGYFGGGFGKGFTPPTTPTTAPSGGTPVSGTGSFGRGGGFAPGAPVVGTGGGCLEICSRSQAGIANAAATPVREGLKTALRQVAPYLGIAIGGATAGAIAFNFQGLQDQLKKVGNNIQTGFSQAIEGTGIFGERFPRPPFDVNVLNWQEWKLPEMKLPEAKDWKLPTFTWPKLEWPKWEWPKLDWTKILVPGLTPTPGGIEGEGEQPATGKEDKLQDLINRLTPNELGLESVDRYKYQLGQSQYMEQFRISKEEMQARYDELFHPEKARKAAEDAQKTNDEITTNFWESIGVAAQSTSQQALGQVIKSLEDGNVALGAAAGVAGGIFLSVFDNIVKGAQGVASKVVGIPLKLPNIEAFGFDFFGGEQKAFAEEQKFGSLSISDAAAQTKVTDADKQMVDAYNRIFHPDKITSASQQAIAVSNDSATSFWEQLGDTTENTSTSALTMVTNSIKDGAKMVGNTRQDLLSAFGKIIDAIEKFVKDAKKASSGSNIDTAVYQPPPIQPTFTPSSTSTQALSTSNIKTASTSSTASATNTVQFGSYQITVGGGLQSAVKKYADGGILNETVFGIGKSGQTYLLGESGPEAIMPLSGKTGSGGKTIIINVTNNNQGGLIATREVQEITTDTLMRALRQAGFGD